MSSGQRAFPGRVYRNGGTRCRHARKSARCLGAASRRQERRRRRPGEEPPSYRGLGRYLRFLGPREDDSESEDTDQADRAFETGTADVNRGARTGENISLTKAMQQLFQTAELQSSSWKNARSESLNGLPEGSPAGQGKVSDEGEKQEGNRDSGFRLAAEEAIEAAQATQTAMWTGGIGWGNRSSSESERERESESPAGRMTLWERKHVPDLSPYLHSVSTKHLRYLHKVAFLCSCAYSIGSMKRFRALELMGMELVKTSLEDQAEFEKAKEINGQEESRPLLMSDSQYERSTAQLFERATEDESTKVPGNGEVMSGDATSKAKPIWSRLGSLVQSRAPDANTIEGSSARELAKEALTEENEQLAEENNSIVSRLASLLKPLADKTAADNTQSLQSWRSFLTAAAPLAKAAAAGSATASEALAATVKPLSEATRQGGMAAYASLAGLASSVGAAAQGGLSKVHSQRQSEPQADAATGFSCPCDWFIADEKATSTRFFVIEGTDSVATWQTNISFDPVTFEDDELNIRIHRGVYQAAQALYPIVERYVEQHAGAMSVNDSPKFVLTGHSLGGSLAIVLAMMISWRRGDLRWVLGKPYAFGSPDILTDNAPEAGSPWNRPSAPLEKVGLPGNFACSVAMHMDIVPKAFSCDYTLVSNLLQSWGEVFERHACLQNRHHVSLYSPYGARIIIQPDKQFVEQHPYLPEGSGVYELRNPWDHGSRLSKRSVRDGTLEEGAVCADDGLWNGSDDDNDDDEYRALEEDELEEEAGWEEGKEAESEEEIEDAIEALYALINTPHPLEMLGDWRAYGPSGLVSVNHNPFHYSRALAYELAKRRRASKAFLPRLYF